MNSSKKLYFQVHNETEMNAFRDFINGLARREKINLSFFNFLSKDYPLVLVISRRQDKLEIVFQKIEDTSGLIIWNFHCLEGFERQILRLFNTWENLRDGGAFLAPGISKGIHVKLDDKYFTLLNAKENVKWPWDNYKTNMDGGETTITPVEVQVKQ